MGGGRSHQSRGSKNVVTGAIVAAGGGGHY